MLTLAKRRLLFNHVYFFLGDKVKVQCVGLPAIIGTIDDFGSGHNGTYLYIKTEVGGLASMNLKELQSMIRIKE